MKSLFTTIFLISYCLCETSFISNDEYASMLYKNPRGIGCNNCHGDHGEGKVIAIYLKNKKKKKLIGPRINDMDQKKFYKAFKKKHEIMPKYYLTDEEKAYLYYYLQKKEKYANR